MSEVDLEALDDKELLKRYQDLWVSRMYYMAAEGNWSAETEARNECERKYYAVISEMNKRGLKYE